MPISAIGLPPHQGCQRRLVAAADVVLQQLGIGQPGPVPPKDRPA
jgi:hypothetical protein